ncbi:MAG: glycosyltransferase [bacterium]
MNVLIIKNDPTIINSIGTGSLQRHITYANSLKKLFVVTKTIGGSSKILYPTENFEIHPTALKHKCFFTPIAFKLANEIIKKNTIDVIITQDPFECGLIGYVLSKKYKIPLSVELRADIIDNFFYLKEKFINLIFNQLGKFILKKADTIDVGTFYEKKKLISFFKIPEHKILVIPTPINFNSFLQEFNDEIRNFYLNKGFDKIVLSVGRIEKQKDFPTLLKSAKIIIKSFPKTLFLIVGEGSNLLHLKKIVQTQFFEKNIIFTGFISYNEIPKYYAACDVFVMSSVYEGTSKTLQEAGVTKKPCITTNFAGANEVIINNQTGFVVPIKNFKTLAEKIIYLLQNSDIAQKMGNDSKEYILNKFSEKKNIEKYIEKIFFTGKIKK